MNYKKLKLSDGRMLAYYDNESMQGVSALFFHGFPASGYQGMSLEHSKYATRLRIISPDRPGLGGSDPNPNASVESFAKDLEELLNHLNIEKIQLIGVSGGSPYLTAAAAHLGDRAEKAILICPLGPLCLKEVRSHMPKELKALLKVHRIVPWFAPLYFNKGIRVFEKDPYGQFEKIKLSFPPVDQQALKSEEFNEILVQSSLRAYQQGSVGVIADINNYLKPWKFDVKKINVPFSIWHGDLDERVPLAVGQWYQRNLNKVQFQVVPGEGHFSLPWKYVDQVLPHIT
jgi:pimeloyl-ACP methyl ester carboxylesterase